MILTRRKSVWTRQPQGPVEVDWRSPITRGLALAWLPTGQIITRFGQLGSVATNGFGARSVGRNGSLRAYGQSGLAVNASPLDVNTASDQTYLLIGQPPPNFDWSMAISTGTGSFRKYFKYFSIARWPSGVSALASSAQWTSESVVVAQVRANGSGQRFFVDGLDKTNGAGSNWGDSYSINRTQLFQGAVGDRSSATYWTNGAALGVKWDRYLSAAELNDLSANPWQIFRPRTRTTIISLGAGSSSSNLNASASGAAQSGGSASLAAQVALAGVGVAVAGGSAVAGVSVPLSAAGIAIAGGSADATATVRISAAGLAQAAGSAGLSASILLAAAGTAQAAGNATLAAQLAALASGSAQASGSATLSGGAPGALAASGGAQSGGQAVLSVTVQLAATGAAQAGGSATGSASAPGQIAASGSAQAGGSATVSVTVQITAAGFVQAMGAGELTVHIPISASGGAISAGLANLTAGGVVRSVAPCRQIQVAAERRAIAVPAERRRLAVPAENRRVRVL